MKRKPKTKLVLDQATITVLTPQDFARIHGGGGGTKVDIQGIAATMRRC